MFLENASRKGWIEVVCGSMFSGKTEELIRRLKRAKFAHQRVEIFKPRIDVRYSEEEVVSHDANAIRSTPVESPQNILLMTADVDVVGIDEAQFFDESIVDVCRRLANNGVRVIVAGLDMDYTGKPFGPMPALMATAEYVTKVHAICVRCGNLAHHSHRLTSDEKQVMLGAQDSYEPICRHCFNKLMNGEKAWSPAAGRRVRQKTAVRKSGLRFCFAGQGLRPPARGRPSAGGAQGVDEAGPEHPEIFGLEPQFAGLRGGRGSFAPDVAQIRFVGRMLVGGKFGEEGRKMRPESLQLPFGQSSVTAESRPQQQHLTPRMLVRHVVDHLVEQLLLVQGQVVEGQQFAPFQMVLGVEFQQHFQERRRHFEIVDQEVVDGRGEDQFERRARIAVAPFEIDLLVLGNQLRKTLEGLKTLVAGSFYIAGGLHLAGPGEDFHEITGSFADHLESLVGRRFKICLLHRCL